MSKGIDQEKEKFRQHSILLNSILWRMMEFTGDVGDTDLEKEAVPSEVADRFFERIRGRSL